MSAPSDTHLTIGELCARWKVTPQTLRNYRRSGTGPQPFQLFPGRRGLRYRQSEVVDYENECARAHGLATAGERAA